MAGESTIKAFLEKLKNKERNQIFDALDQLNTSGIDLSQFAKQTIAYIDQHLLEDTDFYLQICGMFGEILSTLRRYPYPVVAYKIAINKFLNPEIENPAKIRQNTRATPQPASPSTLSQNSIKEEKLKEKSEERIASEAPITTPTPIKTNPQTEEDFKNLWQTVIQKFPKPTTQANLKDAALIEKKEGNQIFIIVITKIAEMLLNNQENKKQLEELLSEQLGETVQIQNTYESKEDYFARKMKT